MGFVFRDRVLKITIAGNEFDVEIDAEHGKTVNIIAPAAVATVKEYQKGTKTEKEAIGEFKGFINDVLGDKKAADKIFAAHVPDIRDCMDVVTYIANKIADFNQSAGEDLRSN